MSPIVLPLRAVLFDLDGTLIDSAPDIVAALNALRDEYDQLPVDYTAVREVISRGSRAIIRRGFPNIDETHIETMVPRFLDLYFENLAVGTVLYTGIAEILAQLEKRGIHWGIVTNKPGWLARPLLEQMGLAARCAALVTGDCLSVRKPDPQPVLRACEMLGVASHEVVFVGDDERDILAGRAAGTLTVAAAYGYLDGADPMAWGADYLIHTPSELSQVLGLV